MVNITTAKKIGSKQAYKAITVGLVVAYLIMALLSGPMWLLDFSYTPTLIFTAFVLYGTGYLFGGMAGKFIIVNKYPSIFVGILSGFLIICSATFIGSLIGFFNEGIPNKSSISDPFEDYILKPILMVCFWGFIPIVAIGVWYGLSIRKKGMYANSD